MYRKQVTETSPMRILERSIHGGLGAGNLGVVMARAGVGKTALLVRMGLDDNLRERAVLHVTLDQSLEHAMGWYDALFTDLEARTHLEDPHAVRDQMQRLRVIQAFRDRQLSAERLRQVVEMFRASMKFEPQVILVDGYDWDADSHKREDIAAFKKLASEIGAEVWMTAQTHREVTSAHPTKLVPPCETCEDLIDVAVFLEPKGNHVAIRLLKDHDNTDLADTNLELDPDTMRIVTDESRSTKLLPQAFTLLSGGHLGTEAAFGVAAEKRGVHEKNFSFKGRQPSRKISLVELDEARLREGEVSKKYIETQLHRSFPETPEWRRILDTIWHQVNTAGQVFIIGAIQQDDTVKGGTGWAAELAKHFHKVLFVYDQERSTWNTWTGSAWETCEPPKVTSRRFCGTGTQELSDNGKEAIDALFVRSFES